MTFIAGAFNATFDAVPLGTTEDGFEMITSRIYEEIRADHNRGLLDGVFQGIDMMIRTVLLEFDMPAVQRLLWPFDHDHDGTLNEQAGLGRMGSTGQLISSFARPLVLTPCSGTTAATRGKENLSTGLSGPLVNITFARVVLSAEATAIKYAASLRKLPITLLVLPFTCYGTAPTYPFASPVCDNVNSMVYYGYDLTANPCVAI